MMHDAKLAFSLYSMHVLSHLRHISIQPSSRTRYSRDDQYCNAPVEWNIPFREVFPSGNNILDSLPCVFHGNPAR